MPTGEILYFLYLVAIFLSLFYFSFRFVSVAISIPMLSSPLLT